MAEVRRSTSSHPPAYAAGLVEQHHGVPVPRSRAATPLTRGSRLVRSSWSSIVLMSFRVGRFACTVPDYEATLGAHFGYLAA